MPSSPLQRDLGTSTGSGGAFPFGEDWDELLISVDRASVADRGAGVGLDDGAADFPVEGKRLCCFSSRLTFSEEDWLAATDEALEPMSDWVDGAICAF
jgi:hypothetical protein